VAGILPPTSKSKEKAHHSQNSEQSIEFIICLGPVFLIQVLLHHFWCYSCSSPSLGKPCFPSSILIKLGNNPQKRPVYAAFHTSEQLPSLLRIFI
jgi:hypothetical protein